MIRKLLWQEWDPIGVNDATDAQDEYDSYAGKIYTMLLENSTQSTIADHLFSIETERMGLNATPQAKLKTLRVAASLLALKAKFEASNDLK